MQNGYDNGVHRIRPKKTPEEVIQSILERFSSKGGGGGGWKIVIPIILILIVIIGGMSSFYTIEPHERGVVTRLGQYQSTRTEGLHFKLPFGIERVYKVQTNVIPMDFGYREASSSGRRSTYTKERYTDESLMLTGDLNVADVEWQILYRIEDPVKFLFSARDVPQNIRDVSMSIMRRVVGDRSATEVLTTQRVEIASEAKALTQKLLDQYELGVDIVSFKLQDVNPPDRVKPAFNEVNSARQEQEQTINNAERQYNSVIPEARGKAEQTIAYAQGFAKEVVNRAHGDVAKFAALSQEYAKAPKITRDRLYLETMEEIFEDSDQVIVVDESVKGVLPLFGVGQAAGTLTGEGK